MAMIFFLLGALVIIAGLGWTALVVGLGLGGSSLLVAPDAGVGVLVATALPGLGVAFCGLLLLAVGRALKLLAVIARNTRDPVRGFVSAPPARPGKPQPPPQQQQAPAPPPRPPEAPPPPSFMDFDITRERR